MRTDPIIPIWLMSVICVLLLCLVRRNKAAYVRQIIAVVLVFVINLRIMVPYGEVKTETQTLDTYVLFVIDDTISMVAQDYKGDGRRLDAVKSDCGDIVDELNGAKFGVITFNNSANLVCPFTDDADYTKSVLDSIAPLDSLYATGSSMNVCIDVATDTLKRASEKQDGSVAVFFISDGEITNGDTLKSFSDLKEYADYGAVMGYGTDEGGNMYVQSYYEDTTELLYDTSTYPYEPAVSKIDEGNLKQIAKDIGVSYVNMNDGTVDGVLKDIKQNSNTAGESRTQEGWIDIYYVFAAAFIVLMMYDFIALRRRVGGVS